MLRNKKAARIYATALLETLENSGEVEQWEVILNGLAQTKELFFTTASTRPRLREFHVLVIEPLLASIPTSLGSKLRNLLSILFLNRHLALLPQIFAAFIRLSARRQGLELVVLVTARPWSQTERQTAQSTLGNIFSSMRLHWRQDPRLLAGAKILYQDWVIDLSGRQKLKQLRQKFANS